MMKMFKIITNEIRNQYVRPSKRTEYISLTLSVIAIIITLVSTSWTIIDTMNTEKISQAKDVTGWLSSKSNLPFLPDTSKEGGVTVKASTDTDLSNKNYHGFVINNNSKAPIYNVLIFVADLTKPVTSLSEEKSINKYSPRYISLITPGKKVIDITQNINNKSLKYGTSFFFCDTNQHYWLRTQHGKLIATSKNRISRFIKNNKMNINNTNVYIK